MRRYAQIATLAFVFLLSGVTAFAHSGAQTDAPEAGEEVLILTTDQGQIAIRLFGDETPETVKSITTLAQNGFYDGVRFHRIIPGFVIQTGDPLSRDDSDQSNDGTGGPGYETPDEVTPVLQNIRGSVAMANSGPGTNGSQFYINLVDNHNLDGTYTVFGQVYQGMEVADNIARVSTHLSGPLKNQPLSPVVLDSATVTTAGSEAIEAAKTDNDRPTTFGGVMKIVFWVLLGLIVVLGIALLIGYFLLRRSMPTPRQYVGSRAHRKKRHKTFGANK